MSGFAGLGGFGGGTPGPPIDTGGRFEFHKSPAAKDWVIAHNLNFRYVLVQVVDDSGNTVIPDVHYTNANRADLVFATPVEGTAILRR